MVSMLDSLRIKNESDQNRLLEKQAEVETKSASLLRDKERLSQLDTKLSLYCQQARCDNVANLLEVGQKSDLKRTWRARILDCQEQLTQFCGGLELEQFLDEVRAERERV